MIFGYINNQLCFFRLFQNKYFNHYNKFCEKILAFLVGKI
jgi:hypothetical protein